MKQASDTPRPRTGSIRPFLLWLGGFYTIWLAIVLIGDHWATIADHWRIAAAMAAGSYFAGSTPMGGGTVGFPILVLLLSEPATIGRDFSLAVQSIGMISASIFIIALRRKLEVRLLAWALGGALVATPLGAAFIAPNINDLTIKLLFAVIWASFGVMHFVKLRELIGASGISKTSTSFDREIGLTVGVLGGISASITGVGIDMVLYAVLTLLYRSDLKIAIPTSIVAMACTSVIGFFAHFALGNVQPAVFGHWIAAAPIVAVGAPFGALVVHYLPRAPTLIIVSCLCIGQFVWTMIHESIVGAPLLMAIGGVLAFNLMFHVMYKRGESLARRSADAPEIPQPRASAADA